MPNDPTTSALVDRTLEAALLGATSPEPIVIDDVESDPRVDAETMRALGIKSLMAVPIVTQNATIGTLFFHHRTEQVSFTPEQLEFARILMGMVGLALENARLYERERHIADTLQSAVLTAPEPVDGIECSVVYRPASPIANIGGDFYDLFPIDECRVSLVIGDVSGKGLEAAPLTLLLHDGIRAFAYEKHDPSGVVSRLNRLVHHVSTPAAFATLIYGVMEPSTGCFEYCRAGHPEPVVVSPEGARALGGDHSTIVGGFADSEFTTSETVLQVGEMLVLFTDGITEARAGTELFGEERLLAALHELRETPTKHVPDRLLEKVLDFAGGELSDDTIVMCVRRTHMPSAS